MDDRFIVGTGLVAGSGLRRAQLITTGRPRKVAENSQKTQCIEISRSGRVERVQIPGVLSAGEKRVQDRAVGPESDEDEESGGFRWAANSRLLLLSTNQRPRPMRG